MATGANVVEVDDASFEERVLAESKTRPVVVDFWAPWCAPCRALGPVLERLAGEGNGRFVVAKVNTDENPAWAKTFGVRGIPAVFAVKDGEVVDQFTGAQPEPMVRKFLDGVAPDPTEKLVRTALAALQAKGFETARRAFQKVLELDKDSAAGHLGTALFLARDGDADGARAHLAAAGDAPAALAGLAFQVQNALDASVVEVDVDAERRALADAPDAARAQRLAGALFSRDQADDAFGVLLDGIKRIKGPDRDDLRKAMVTGFDAIGRSDVVERWRKELAAVWFS